MAAETLQTASGGMPFSKRLLSFQSEDVLFSCMTGNEGKAKLSIQLLGREENLIIYTNTSIMYLHTILEVLGALFKGLVTLEKFPSPVWMLKLLDGIVVDRQPTQHKPSSETALQC